MRLLVLGSTGMAGHAIATYFEERGDCEVHNISHSTALNERSVRMDLTRTEALEAYLAAGEPFDAIVNCVGVLIRESEENKAKAIQLNAYLPRYLERRFQGERTKIVHLSTDCVFSGRRGGYVEDDFRDGDTFYDRTKIVGELNNGKDLTIRTSIVGPELREDGVGLFHWFMKQRGVVNGYANAYWTGVTTVELARAVEAALLQGVSGLYHLVPAAKISKYELLTIFKEVFGRDDIEVERFENAFVDKSLVNTRTDFRFEVEDYRAMAERMRDWIEAHKPLYGHYFR
ncbi:SDR family oxidoreductase [Paenibacillus sp.]|uniref:dTDP-4-dehydrorhamnose reductase family protein n=1 Tax=Paenibacillus sp. TaxID=58172 RepID=UPI002D42979C|nr:SDR family oxidoreductase [Paenibacillus sp.]HZG58500.1 SDR family oxidoreductase [Paenibacillus sp.]